VVVAVVAVVALTAALIVAAVALPLADRDLPVWIGNVLVGGTFFLAAVAAIVAIAAYAVSLRRPVLSPQIKFRYSDWNKPALAADSKAANGRRPLLVNIQRGHQSVYTRQGEAQLQIHNRSRWSARNPALRVELSDMGFLRQDMGAGWRVEKQNGAQGVYSIIWEGGIDRPIHGEWTANLPDLNFVEAKVLGPNPSITLDVVAEGFHDVKRLTVQLLTEAELAERMTTFGDQR